MGLYLGCVLNLDDSVAGVQHLSCHSVLPSAFTKRRSVLPRRKGHASYPGMLYSGSRPNGDTGRLAAQDSLLFDHAAAPDRVFVPRHGQHCATLPLVP